MPKRPVVLIVGHGSREASANQEFEQLVARYQARRPDLEVRYGYVELAQPSLSDALAEIPADCDEAILLPLFLFAAGHVKNDLPLALAAARRQRPTVSFRAARALGVHAALVGLALERAEESASSAPDEASRTAAIVVGRGSSDPDANGDFCKFARMVAEARSFAWVVPAFIGITRPKFEETLEFVARARPERLLVLPYLLFGGRLLSQLQNQVADFLARYPWIKTTLAPHLGVHESLLAVLDERLAEARNGQAPLPCDNCQYRAALPGRAESLGGLRALLWSLRHSFTHAQAAPHVHAHRPMSKHVLVCGNIDCAARGSMGLVESLRRSLKDAGRERDVRVTVTSCMGRCGEGPTVAVYPDGIWYRGVREEDAAELVEEHLLADRLVARLVDNIMQ
ncbi:MAG TPA: CbiX/SirB N-terminal domain-containing protein [Pirellulales bacterium]|nr:CbiX/SirB N-terminal domain-containing protein [Pirellulales bacterium]